MIAVALNSCALLGADFFPLQDGNTRTYRETVTGQTFSVRVGQPVTTAGHLYYKLTGYADSDLLVPLTLSFTSGQEYDFALNDSAGTTLWLWSASRTFLQALHQRTVTDEWSATVEIPWPTAPGGDLQSGNYTVRAFVTAAASTPFAATVPVTIPAKQ